MKTEQQIYYEQKTIQRINESRLILRTVTIAFFLSMLFIGYFWEIEGLALIVFLSSICGFCISYFLGKKYPATIEDIQDI